MRLRVIVGSIVSMLLLTLVIVLLIGRTNVAEATEITDSLKTALVKINVPQPGQIAHYSYTIYRRVPPANLEPSDPYHLPYAKIWPAKELEDTWLEIGLDGKTARWRTQLRSAEGELLQDLMFDGVMETDYFPLDNKATRFAEQANSFRDNRVALIEDFLQSESLSRRKGTSVEGGEVLSIYTKAKQFDHVQDVNAALLNFTSPFIADLTSVSLASRIDFDPMTLSPIGEAQVVWDRSGTEYVISYRTFLAPEILQASQAQEVFRQEVPEEAFQDSQSMPVETKALTDLDTVAQSVTYPIYALRDTTTNLHRATTMEALTNGNHPVSKYQRGIEFASALGLGVQSIYVNQDNTARLSVIQGPTAAMKSAFQQTMPTWLKAEQIQARLGTRQVPAWRLEGADAGRLRYVIESGATILYIDSQGLWQDDVLELLQSFAPLR